MGAPEQQNTRRVMLASILLGLFLLLDIALFGWLIFRSLSKREIERVLLETREEAEGLAARLAGRAQLEGGDLYTVTSTEREVQTYIDSILKQRKIIQTVEVVDTEGKLVFRGENEAELRLGPAESPLIETGESLKRVEIPLERERTFPLEELPDSLYQLNLPIGELGFLQIGISQGELQKRIGTLRSELVNTTATIATLTLIVLILAQVVIWRLWRRSQRLQEQAHESERMAYIGTLASGLAHEIRNPLNSLNLNMQMLEEELEGRPPAHSGQRLMSITRDEIHRLERLVTAFLQYAKPPPVEVVEVPALSLLQRCDRVLASELEARGARIWIDDRSKGALVRVDPAQMSQLLLNLVQNAMAAMEERGLPPKVRLGAVLDGARVVLEVEDRGVGMTVAQKEQMFDLFYSTRKGGTGLGLAIASRIARTHEAEIEVESELNQGTTIKISLAVSEAALSESRSQEPIRVSKSSGVRN
jgi:signal transduction histidine kinase